VRSMLRYRRGSFGDKNRRTAHIVEPKLSTIAEGLAKLGNYEPTREYPLEIGPGKVLVISDVHIPYHEPKAVELALEAGKEWGATTLLINGDLLDFYQVSRFDKDPKRWPIATEISIANGFLDLLQEQFERVVFKFGNHDERLSIYIRTKAQELDGLAGLTLEEQLNLDERGIEYRKKERIKLGKLNVIHGHELPHGISAPVNAARGVFLRAKASTLVGHHHQVSEHSEGDLDGGTMGCWSIGCLCDLKPDYAYYGGLKWSHGFALVEVFDDLTYVVQNKRIINGRVY
jgi:predicted phosphodiesterase